MREKEVNKAEDLKSEGSEQVFCESENEKSYFKQNLKEAEDNQVEINDFTKKIAEKDTLLDQKEKEIVELKNKLLRIQADFDNYRKRNNKEKQEWFRYACCGLVEKLLPVLDNLDRAMLSLDEQNEEIKNVFSGIQMIVKQFKEILQKEGLTPIEAVGVDFDPHLHEAVMQVPTEDGVADNQVVEEVRKGYCFKDKVLRVSMVKVAKCD
ncbi:MAG: nucleotide exchange factor GrpE [Peptococcia bacterium]